LFQKLARQAAELRQKCRQSIVTVGLVLLRLPEALQTVPAQQLTTKELKGMKQKAFSR
jgi:hypothetical protein